MTRKVDITRINVAIDEAKLIFAKDEHLRINTMELVELILKYGSWTSEESEK